MIASNSLVFVLCLSLPAFAQEGSKTTSESPTFDDLNVMSYHSGGSYDLFGDGSVRFLKETISMRVFTALVTRAGAEILSADQY